MIAHPIISLPRFATLFGTFTSDGIREFLRGVLSGRIATGPVIEEPHVDTDTSNCGLQGKKQMLSFLLYYESLQNGPPCSCHCLCWCCDPSGGAKEELVEDEEDIGDVMAEILAEEKRKKEELAAEVRRELEERKQ